VREKRWSGLWGWRGCKRWVRGRLCLAEGEGNGQGGWLMMVVGQGKGRVGVR